MSNAKIQARQLSMEFGLVRSSSKLGWFSKRLLNDNPRSKILALNTLTFEFSTGDRIGIIGENGAGKSTLLKIISGVLQPTNGQLSIVGTRTSLLDLNVDIVANASCTQNIHLRGYSLGLKRSEIASFESYVRSNAALERFIHSPVSMLSAGMKTRLLVSMIGYVNAEILIMDEWISTADKSFYERSNSVLNNLVEKSKIFVLASHDRKIVEKLCNKVLVLSEGRIIFYGGVGDGYIAMDESQKQR